MTKEIFEIVWKSDIKTKMTVRTNDELDELRKFRNKVAHGNYLIVNDEDIIHLRQTHDRICEYITALEGI